VSTEAVSACDRKHLAAGGDKNRRSNLIWSVCVFLFSYFVLFLGMSRHPYIYDEGLVLTAAMRVAAGQIPHRDFYANYAPAQFYILAGLFKLFGNSLLVERLFDLLIKALLVASIYGIVASLCRRWIAACTAMVTMLWLIGLHDLPGTPVVPVSLLNLTSSFLILPVFIRIVSTRRMLVAGIIVGVAAMFRYDVGVALLGVHMCAMALAIWLKLDANRLRAFASICWPHLLGFAAATLPPALYYLSVAPLRFFVHDMIVYPSRYYHRGRNLPFSGVYLHGLENLGLYLPILIALLSLSFALLPAVRARWSASRDVKPSARMERWRALLVIFGLLAAVMYLKGFVRVSLTQMYLSIVPSLVLIAVLFGHRQTLPRLGRISVMFLAGLSGVAATSAALHAVKGFYLGHVSVLSFPAQSTPEIQTWCNYPNPLTRGFCFYPEQERRQTIEFIDSHTTPEQTLYVGVTRHDRIFANDNITYFATQRLPATHWSHFDPFLQNSKEVQAEMIHELQVNSPPYVVLDSEFDQIHEPNDSSTSTRITMLDEYIRSAYLPAQSFGRLSIWKRKE
jgi:hypothetical protein